MFYRLFVFCSDRAWLNEMIAKITAPDLSRDLTGAELQVATHGEYESEIQTRLEAVERFTRSGNELIANGHFLAEDIQDKVHTLKQRYEVLRDSARRRHDIYEQNLDAQRFQQDASQLDAWLLSREKLLQTDDVGSSIAEVEELIRHHDDFQKTLEAQEDKAQALRYFTIFPKLFIINIFINILNSILNTSFICSFHEPCRSLKTKNEDFSLDRLFLGIESTRSHQPGNFKENAQKMTHSNDPFQAGDAHRERLPAPAQTRRGDAQSRSSAPRPGPPRGRQAQGGPAHHQRQSLFFTFGTFWNCPFWEETLVVRRLSIKLLEALGFDLTRSVTVSISSRVLFVEAISDVAHWVAGLDRVEAGFFI